jgi:hypothetical protein
MSKQEKGSKYRCFLLSISKNKEIVKFLNEFISSPDEVTDKDCWQPNANGNPGETTLTNLSEFLSDENNIDLRNWWLDPGIARGKLPTWDFVSSYTSNENQKGLILIEAKAHNREFNTTSDKCGSQSKQHSSSISEAVREANYGLNNLKQFQNESNEDEFKLKIEKAYQLSNRFAFAWKLANEGIPVVLVYLGFLNAEEMGNNFFQKHDDWHNYVINKTKSIIPQQAWNQTFEVNGTPLTFLIKSAKVEINPEVSVSKES